MGKEKKCSNFNLRLKVINLLCGTITKVQTREKENLNILSSLKTPVLQTDNDNNTETKRIDNCALSSVQDSPHYHWDHCSLVSPLVTVQITESVPAPDTRAADRSANVCQPKSGPAQYGAVRRSTAQYSTVQSTVQPGELRRGDHGTSGTAELQVALLYYQAWSAYYRATGRCVGRDM